MAKNVKTRAEKIEAVRDAVHLGVVEASRKHKVSRQTIAQWKKQYSGSVESIEEAGRLVELDMIFDGLEKKYNDSVGNFRKAVEVVKFTALQKILLLINSETNVKDLNQTLKVLHEISKEQDTALETKDNKSFLSMIENQILKMQEVTDIESK